VSRSLALVAALVATSSAVHAQTWTADLYAGGTSYAGLSDRASATNLIANLRYQGLRGLLTYVSVAAPLDGEAPLWGAAGGSRRLTRFTTRPWSFGVELGAHGYAFHERTSDDIGGGAEVTALPFVALAHRIGSLELRGGWHQHAFGYVDTTGGRGLLEAGARASAARDWYAVQLDARWLRASEATYPYVGVQLAAAPAFVRLWGWTGRWFGDERPGTLWGIGGSLPVGPLGELWVSFRRDATDPVFLNTPRDGWNVGVSRQLGERRPAAAAALAPKVERGAVQIRLPLSAMAAAHGGAPSVAGEFSEWRPVPMRRKGGVWVLDLPLGPGVYRFAFVSPDGEWFVPEQYPGRMDDGMGGHIAVLVVS
jgi:hypothetical protein